MSPEAQRIAIAEACGWVTACGYENSLRDNVFYGACPARGIEWGRCPDYLNDLNAMHEAVKSLDSEAYSRFCGRLILSFKSDELLPYLTLEDSMAARAMNATAAQRAEAFLRTLNLRDDSK